MMLGFKKSERTVHHFDPLPRLTLVLPYSSMMLILLIILLYGAPMTQCDDHEMRLLKHLMNNYDPAVRPAKHFSEPLIVNFSLSLHHIIDVDEKNQILTSSCWLTQIWRDVHLTWNESEFGGVSVVRLPYHKVWRPDIILYNNADSQYSSAVINTNVIVTSAGDVTWLSHGIYKSSCDINVEYFPFDIQNCTLKWASWTYDGYQLDLLIETEEGDTSNYHANGEFDLLNLRAYKHVQVYSCCPEPYPDVTYTILMKRRPMFYVFNLIIPCLLINGIALLVFFVPCDSGEKVTLGISALLSMTVFLMTIRESLPPTEKTPLIALYYGVSICIVTFASALAVFTLNIHHRGFRGVTVPGPLRFICLKVLAKVLLIQGDPAGVEGDPNNQNGVGHDAAQDKDAGRDLDAFRELRLQLNGLHPAIRLDSRSASRKYDYSSDIIQRSPRFDLKSSSSPSTSLSRPQGLPPPQPIHVQSNMMGSNPALDELVDQKFGRIVGKICETIERCELRSAAQTKHDANQLEWKKIALVCDRFLFWLFSITTAISVTLILFSSPYGPSLNMLYTFNFSSSNEYEI